MNGQSDWPKSHLCPKWPMLIGQMRFREVETQDVELVCRDYLPPIVIFLKNGLVKFYHFFLCKLCHDFFKPTIN